MRRRWIIAGVLGLLPVLYVLSYAPVCRLRYGKDHEPSLLEIAEMAQRTPMSEPEAWEGLFTPVHWLIDWEPTSKPLDWWAEAWGVDLRQYDESLHRRIVRAVREYENR